MRYRINARDEVIFVDEAWIRFAADNDGTDVFLNAVLGRSLWDFISDHTTRDLYQQIVARVRDGGVARFNLRCDGPDCRRVLEMVIRAGERGEIEFTTESLQVVDRSPVALLDIRAEHSDQFIRACAWCNRIDVGDANWMEVEDAADRLRLFELNATPRMTHGICEECLQRMTELIDAIPTNA